MSGSGGAAAHAGIDFQQRIAALVMMQMLTGIKNYSVLQLGENLDIDALRFETDDAIDDLVLNTSKGRVFIQAKRSIDLSTGENSDFSSVIRQFVRQQIEDEMKDDIYVLATTSRSSRKITQELKKITDAKRLNEDTNATNPATQSETEVLKKIKELAEAHYLDLAKANLPAEGFEQLLRKIRIALIDIELGSYHEAAALTLLSGRTDLPAGAVWGALIALAVSLAKDRLSIDRAGLENKMGSMFQTQHASKAVESTADPLIPFELAGDFSSGRDVILIESFDPSADYLIMELFRFEDDGSRRLRYSDGEVYLKNGLHSRVLYRSATYVGLERFIKESNSVLADARIVILAANQAENVEEKPFVMVHKERCKKLSMTTTPYLRCLHCGDVVSESSTPLIEIDEDGAELAVGLCHKDCVQPLYRVLGEIRSDFFQENKSLKNFDYDKWYSLLPRGQAIFRSAMHLPGVKVMLWNPGYRHSSTGQWCVRIDLADGSARYVHERGRVVRNGEQEAEKKASEFSESFKLAKSRNDPWVYTSSDAFTTHDAAMKHLGSDESCTECISAKAVRYSASIGASYSAVDSFYAPLIMLVEERSGAQITSQDTIFLLTDPLGLDKYLENWRRAGVEVPKFIPAIISTDAEFDTLMRQLKDDNLAAIVDPMIAATGELSRGFHLKNYDEVMEAGQL